MWINYGPSGNNLKALWRFDRTEGAAFFNAAGFEVIDAAAHRVTNLDVRSACPSVSFRNTVCYLTVARKAGRPGEKSVEAPPGKAPFAAGEVAPIVPRHFPGAHLAHSLATGEQGKISFRHERVPGRGESWQIGGRAARILTLVDGKRSVRDIAELLSRRDPPHPVEETLRVVARFFAQGLLSWQGDGRDPYHRAPRRPY